MFARRQVARRNSTIDNKFKQQALEESLEGFDCFEEECYNNNMRIGINASFLRKPGTGIGQVTLNFLQTLAKSPEAKAHTFFLYLDETVGTCEWPENFKQRVFLPFWKRDDIPRKILWEKKLAGVAQRDQCDVFLSLSQSGTVFPANMQHVMMVHDIIPFLFPGYTKKLSQKWHQREIKRAMHLASRLVVVSQATKKDLITFGLPAEKISVAYPAVSPQFSHPLSEQALQKVLEKFHLKPGYLYHGGGLERRKNTERLLEAYANLRERDKKGGLSFELPKLAISGKVFPESNTLATPVKNIIRHFGLEERVILTDFLPEEEIRALYQGAALFLYPSLYEGFGIPVLEAMTLGIPVLTSRTSSLPEVGGDAVFYVNPESVSEIQNGIVKVLTDGNLRQELISKSRVQALQFKWPEFVSAVLQAVLRPL